METPMRTISVRAVLAAAVAVGTGCSESGQTVQAQAVTGDFAFVDVSVLPMTSERVLEHHTVVVEDGRISWIGPADQADLTAVTTQVAGEGRFLLPGLAEMHAHVPGDNAPADLTEDILFLYLANGITTMRGMLGAPGQLVLRERIERGELPGPRFIVGAPSANGNSTRTPRQAERHMRSAAETGYDFMKIHPGIPLAAWDRLVEVADSVGMTLAGHVPLDVGLEHALTSGIATVDHLDGFFQSAITPEERQRLADANLGVIPTTALLDAVEPVELGRLVDLAAQLGVWQVPTMYLWENFYAPLPVGEFLSRPGMQYVPQSMRDGWVRQKQDRPEEAFEVAAAMADARVNLLRILYEAGAPILMGTDAPQMFNVPGFSLHHEIEVMAKAMPPYAVLEAGTRNVSGYVSQSLGQPADFGTVSLGNRADLLLVDQNPIEDLSTLARPAGVMAAGQWWDRAALDERLNTLQAKYGGGSP